jgi:hypothetical protein
MNLGLKFSGTFVLDSELDSKAALRKSIPHLPIGFLSIKRLV